MSWSRLDPDAAEAGFDQVERKARLSRLVGERRPGRRHQPQLRGLRRHCDGQSGERKQEGSRTQPVAATADAIV